MPPGGQHKCAEGREGLLCVLVPRHPDRAPVAHPQLHPVGPDLARGTADFTRVKSASVAENETRVIADVMAAAAIAEEDGDDISGDMRDGQALASA